MDTGSDPRFAIIEAALNDLRGIFQQARVKAQFPKQKALGAVERANSALMALRYSYAEPDAVRGMDAYGDLQASADEIETLLGGPGFAERIKEDALSVARVAWAVGNIRSLGPRLDLPGSAYENAVDVATGRVVSTAAHPDADSLQVCRVAAGRSLRVVTNDLKVAKDDAVGVALLPPVDLRGVVSTAMFLGTGSGVLTDIEPRDDGRPDVPEAAYAEVRGLVAGYIQGK